MDSRISVWATSRRMSHNISMPCDHCLDALAKGEKFCSNCGSATDALTVEALNRQIVNLTAQVGELVAASKGTEQKLLEVDTAHVVG